MARVLVVDDDPWTQRMVSAVLSHAGHQVDLAADGWEALIRVGRSRPDLVISEVRLPTTDGWSFAATLRSRPEQADVPFIFLAGFGADRTPGPGFRAGRDELVPKPFRLEQLEAAVTVVLTRLGIAPTAPPPAAPDTSAADGSGMRRVSLTGEMEQFGLSSVLIVLELERKSGVLIIHGPDAIGRIFLRDGRVVRAQVDGAGTRRGTHAVYDMLGWGQGRFEFNAGAVRGEDEIGASTSFLLLEGARLQDERDQQPPKNN